MDCRKALFPAVWLLTGALGCSHRDMVPVTPLRETSPPPLASRSAYHPTKPDDKTARRTPLPGTCVALGNCYVVEASSLSKGSTAREQLHDRARQAFQQALSIDEKHLPAYQAMARLYVDMDDYEHAVATYQKALKYHPKNATVWFDLGMVQSRKKDWPGALDSLARAVELEPENRQYINTLGFALARAGQFQVALACFSRVNSEAQSYYHLARMLQHLKQNDQCRQCLQIAVQKDPSLQPAQQMLASLSAPAPASGAVRQVIHVEESPDPMQETADKPTGKVILPPPPSGL